MLGQRICATEKRTHIMPASGPSTDGSSGPAGSEAGDPYRAICEELYALLSRKRGYYGCGNDPLENALSVEDDGIPAWQYQAARIGEKTRRLRGPLETLKRVETLLDIAGHAVVAIACERRKEEFYGRQIRSNSVAPGQHSGPA
jgi:hypothetical protein